MADDAGAGYGQTVESCPLKAKRTWIEIELVGEDNQPRPGLRYRILLPDGSSSEGTLDDSGVARVDGIDSGNCVVSFPDLDKDAWEPAGGQS